MDAYVSKPVQKDELTSAIRQITQLPLSAPTPCVLQQELLDRVGGSVDALRRLLSKFLEVFPNLVGQVREAISANDAEALRHASHKLKGAVGNLLGEDRIEEITTLDAVARHGTLGDAAETWRDAEPKLDQLAGELRSVLQGLGT
jgi:HPt (histidine-containing phosphotransfer) domain-containing protein